MKRTAIRNKMRQNLMNSAMHLVVEEGFSNLTTKKIAQASGLAEMYIYRYFESKTTLLEQCFLEAEDTLGEKIKEILLRKPEGDIEIYIFRIWHEFWEYLMENRDLVIFCIRFYNSSYFTEEILNYTKQNFFNLMDEVHKDNKMWTVENKDSTEKNLLIQYVVNVTVDYAVKVLLGEIENTEKMMCFIYDRIIPPILKEITIKIL